MNIGSIDIDVGLDQKGFNKSVKGISGKMKGLGSNMAKFGKGMAKNVALPMAAAGVAALAFGKKIAGSLDRVDKMSQQMSMSAGAFQEWDFIASQSGTSMESLKTGMKKFGMSMDELSTGVGVGADAFGRLGINMEDMKNKTPEQQFEATITKLQGMEDETKRNAIAMDLFGRAGQDMIPILNSQSGSIDDLKKKAHELGLVQSDEAVKAGAAFTDTLDQTTRMAKGMAVSIGTKLLPMINDFLVWVQNNLPRIKTKFKEVFETYIQPVLEKLSTFFTEVLIPVFNKFKTWLDTNMPIIKSTMKTVFEDYIIPIIEALVTVFKDFLLPILGTLYNWIKIWFPVIKDIIVGALNIIIPVIETVWKLFRDYILPILSDLFNWVDGHMPQVAETFKGAFGKIGDAIEGVIGFLSDVVDGFRTAIDWIKKFNSKSIEEKNPTYHEENGVATSAYNVKGNRANGGHVTKGSDYIVGENGIEKFTAGQSGRITPNSELAGAGGININIDKMQVRNDNDIKRVSRELFSMATSTNRGSGR